MRAAGNGRPVREVPAHALPGPFIDLDARADYCAGIAGQDPVLTAREQDVLARLAGRRNPKVTGRDRTRLARLIDPLEAVSAGWGLALASSRTALLLEMSREPVAYWAWDEQTWVRFLSADNTGPRRGRKAHLLAWAHLFAGHRRLHHRIGLTRLEQLASLVFGAGAADPAVVEVASRLREWGTGPVVKPDLAPSAVLDALLSAGSPHLKAITRPLLETLVTDSPASSARRSGLLKLSRVLAALGYLDQPVSTPKLLGGPRETTLATVPQQWREMILRWRGISTSEPSTVTGRFSSLIIAGRWVADKHPEAPSPADWTRDMAAEYVKDMTTAVRGQWATQGASQAGFGDALSPNAKAARIDSVRAFFLDLIDWEWITPRFDPRQVLGVPISVRAKVAPNPRIIDDATWAKLMAAGLTLTESDLLIYGTPRAKAAGHRTTYYPIEMVRALVGVWLFAGLRIDEIRRLELACVRWDNVTDPDTGENYRACLLHVPANKTSAAFSKPVDPIAGELIGAWQDVRPTQPQIVDRKTGQRGQQLFCHRGVPIGASYLNQRLIPTLCGKAGIPETDSRGALTSHRARATIATQLLNAKEPLSLADLQEWLGHKNPASTRHYAKILQRTLTAAYKRADYFARNVRTIQVLIDRESVLTGAAAGGEQPWKYYDLGQGYCSYDFFAKCPHRLACARCPFYLPKESSAGQLLAVKDGVQQMLEQLDLTDDEREALEGDRDALVALADRLSTIPTPAGPTPQQLGTNLAFIELTAVRDSLTGGTP